MTNKEAAEFIWNVLDGVKSFNEEGGKGLEALNLAIKALEENERPQGEWVKDEEHSIVFDMFKCTICGFWNGAEHFRFCPNCGAEMKGGADNDK